MATPTPASDVLKAIIAGQVGAKWLGDPLDQPPAPPPRPAPPRPVR